MPTPKMILQQMMMKQNPMMNNPMIKNAMGMANINNVQGLQSLAQNLCKEKGLNIQDLQRQVMQRFGIK